MSAQWNLLYTLEYAKQSDYASGDSRLNADHTPLGGSAKWGKPVLRVDYEVLGSNNGPDAFQTTLGTKHPFQGQADQFVVATPSLEIHDGYISGRKNIQKAQILAEYHQYEAGSGSVDFSDRIDIGISYSLIKKLVGKIEYADYRAGDIASGNVAVDKLWLSLIYHYQK